jgi:hypothetical protein
MGKSPVEKKRKRNAALQKKREYDDARAEADRFPEIRIEPTDAPKSLVDAVRTAAKQIRLRHAELLNPADRDFFRDARQRGFAPAGDDAYAKASQSGTEEEFLLFRRLKVIGLGQRLYDLIPREVLEDNILYHCVDVDFSMPRANSILVSFRSLLAAKSSGGKLYYSRWKPTLHIGGREWIVGFSRHAIERIYERSVHDWRTFGGSGDAFALLDNCVYFEDCSEKFGEPCFTLYNTCEPNQPFGDLPRLLLGEDDPCKRYYFRVGYCPAVVEGDFVKAKTLLFPGMRDTPEWELIQRAALPRQEKVRMEEEAKKLVYRQIAETGDYGLIRWFHERGEPQVVSLDCEVFRYE